MGLVEAQRCTPKEFDIYMHARRFKRQERHEDMAFQAWKNRDVQADKRVGKNKTRPYYKRFEDFYDAEQMIRNIVDPQNQEKKRNSIADMNRLLNG